MSRDCPSIEDLPRIAGLPASDPARHHLETCARCRALLASCREFLGPVTLPAEAGLAEAEAHLAAFLDREIVRPGGRGAERAPRRTGHAGLWNAALAWLRPQPVRLALAAAAVVALFVLVRSGGDMTSAPSREPVLRGDAAFPFRAEARRLVSGDVEVHWRAFDGADGYQLVLLGGDLQPRARLEAGRDTLIRVGLETGKAAGEEGPPLFYRIAVLRGGDVVESSPTQPWPRP